jgi:hypothetical protein
MDKMNPEIHLDAWKKAAASDDNENHVTTIDFALVPEGDVLVPTTKTKGAKAEDRFVLVGDTTIMCKDKPEIHLDAWKKAAVSFVISKSVKIELANGDDKMIVIPLMDNANSVIDAYAACGTVLVPTKTKGAKTEALWKHVKTVPPKGNLEVEDTTINHKEKPEVHPDTWKEAVPLGIANQVSNNFMEIQLVCFATVKDVMANENVKPEFHPEGPIDTQNSVIHIDASSTNTKTFSFRPAEDVAKMHHVSVLLYESPPEDVNQKKITEGNSDATHKMHVNVEKVPKNGASLLNHDRLLQSLVTDAGDGENIVSQNIDWAKEDLPTKLEWSVSSSVYSR